MSAMTTSPGGGVQPERRVHHKVREVFTEACAMIAPAMAQAGFSEAAELLRQRYPELTALEIHVLITAAARVRGQRL